MSQSVEKLFKAYSLNTYNRVGPVFVRGKGSWLWDSQGRRYLDLFPGWGVSILGHSHPGIVQALSRQARKLIHLPNNLFFKEQAILAKIIAESSFPSRVFFANSGAEAVEGAIKISRLFGRGKRHQIITMKDSFHGRTFGALSATGQKKYKAPFAPILPGFKEARLNDFESFEKAVNSRTVAVLLELIQGEGGINVAEKEYTQRLRRYCRRRNILFMVDEVQTGMGRTGKLFCYQHYAITPDVMVLSKGLGAGVPISALVVAKPISGIIKPGMHASTFGGSPLVTAVSRETFKIIQQEKLLDNARSLGGYLLKKLSELKKRSPLIREVRGKALMVGLELTIDSWPVFLQCLRKGLLINSTHQNVLRIMPALTVTKDELDSGLSIIEETLAAINKTRVR